MCPKECVERNSPPAPEIKMAVVNSSVKVTGPCYDVLLTLDWDLSTDCLIFEGCFRRRVTVSIPQLLTQYSMDQQAKCAVDGEVLSGNRCTKHTASTRYARNYHVSTSSRPWMSFNARFYGVLCFSFLVLKRVKQRVNFKSRKSAGKST